MYASKPNSLQCMSYKIYVISPEILDMALLLNSEVKPSSKALPCLTFQH